LYRHDSYFYYLSGFTEPKAFLVITGDGKTTLFCQPKDLEREIWDGYRLGPADAPARLGVDAAHSSAELDAHMPALLDGRDAVWYPFATHKGLEARIDGWLGQVRARVRYGTLCPEQQRDLCGLLDEMRLVKDAHEQDVMRRAAQISAGAHIRAMQLSARMLRAGQEVYVEVDAYPNQQFPARVAAVGEVLDPATRRVQVRCVLQNPKRLLKPEMYARVTPLADTPLAERRRLLEAALRSLGKDVDSLIALYQLPDNTPDQRADAVRRINEALRQIENEIQGMPEDANGYNEWAWLVANTEGDAEKATRYSKQSLVKSFDNSSYLDTLAHCRAAAGDLAGAVRWQSLAQRKEPHNHTIRKNLERFQTLAAKAAAQP
jgi:hypothetical protein